MKKLSNTDKEQIIESGRNVKLVEQQMNLISAGKKYLDLVEPALISNGRIRQIKESELTHFEALWKNNIVPYVTKFIPASGAASRMFRALNFVYNEKFETISEIDNEIKKSEKEKEELENLSDFKKFWTELKTFPFYSELGSLLEEKDISINKEIETGKIQNVLRHLLTEEGMNYANKPKLFLTFHEDQGNLRTAMEEHIKEALWLTGGKVHFTVSADDKNRAKKLAKYLTDKYSEKGFKIEVGFSVQNLSTDTVALDPESKELHRNSDGSIFFRQSGHGALSYNLNQIEKNYLLIQNVDNLPGATDEILRWKRVFMGLFFTIEERVLVLAHGLANKDSVSKELIDEAYNYITKDLSRTIDKTEFDSKSQKEKAMYLLNIINRPLALAGVVPNVGEPGGGPFAIKDSETGLPTNQIVEGAQQNLSDPEQLAIVKKSTHFNPVFIILNTKDAWGKKFDMQKYAKRESGYIFYVEKSDSEGKEFASIDTGLWNGEIADTNILFVEMPLETFGPAKTVLDLSPKIRPFRKNPYPEILKDISHEEVLKILNK